MMSGTVGKETVDVSSGVCRSLVSAAARNTADRDRRSVFSSPLLPFSALVDSRRLLPLVLPSLPFTPPSFHALDGAEVPSAIPMASTGTRPAVLRRSIHDSTGGTNRARPQNFRGWFGTRRPADLPRPPRAAADVVAAAVRCDDGDGGLRRGRVRIAFLRGALGLDRLARIAG